MQRMENEPTTEDLATHYLREFAAMEPRTVIDQPEEQEQCSSIPNK